MRSINFRQSCCFSFMLVGRNGSSEGAFGDGLLSKRTTQAVLASIQVLPSEVTVAKGFTESLTAVGLYSDGSTLDISKSVEWSSSDSRIASVSELGTVKGFEEGSTTITASKNDIESNVVDVVINDVIVVDLKVTPAQKNDTRWLFTTVSSKGRVFRWYNEECNGQSCSGLGF